MGAKHKREITGHGGRESIALSPFPIDDFIDPLSFPDSEA